MTTFTKLGDEDLSVVTVKILYAKTVLFIVFVMTTTDDFDRALQHLSVDK